MAALLATAACADHTVPTAPTVSTSQPHFYTYPSAIYRNHLEFGTPLDATSGDEYRISRRTQALSYNCGRGIPNWVSWNLNKTHYGDAARSSSFYTDSSLPSTCYHVTTSDYTNSGYSRGHMTRSEERTWSSTDNHEVFLMTNILPQYQDMNGGPWELFENYANDLATTQNKEVYIVAGGLWTASPATLNNAGKVEIPSYTWKIMVIVPRGTGLANVHSTADLQVVSVMMPNVTGILGQPWQTYQTTVDAIEAATGYDFLAALPDAIETAVEAN
jgi:DNA/RNA endonuclease G (NUC1)